MHWKLFATLAETAGENAVEVPVETTEPTLRDAFDALLETYPELEGHTVDGDGSLQEHIRLLCDGEDPFRAADGWETDVSGVSELALFPPVSGG
ncbi:MAG: ubiquitin-like small modifier protein 1 [Natrialbaceae archaeon]